MRMLSYNILDGGEGRADPLAEVILAQRADVVALVEADHPEVIDRIARRANMDFIYAQGKRHGAALLSRWPIVSSVNHTLFGDGVDLSDVLLEATVRDDTGADWPIFVVHLHAHARESDEERRLQEIDAVLRATLVHRQTARAHVLAGDFNATSPVQQIDPQRCKQSTRDEWNANGGMLPRRAVQRLLDAGYVDTLHAVHPTDAPELGTFSTQFPGQRVDYIFTWGVAPARLSSAWVEQDRLAKYASDHFPVGVEIRSDE